MGRLGAQPCSGVIDLADNDQDCGDGDCGDLDAGISDSRVSDCIGSSATVRSLQSMNADRGASWV